MYFWGNYVFVFPYRICILYTDRAFTCTQEYRISELKNKECKVFNAITIARGYAGRDPLGGTSDGSF